MKGCCRWCWKEGYSTSVRNAADCTSGNTTYCSICATNAESNPKNVAWFALTKRTERVIWNDTSLLSTSNTNKQYFIENAIQLFILINYNIFIDSIFWILNVILFFIDENKILIINWYNYFCSFLLKVILRILQLLSKFKTVKN